MSKYLLDKQTRDGEGKFLPFSFLFDVLWVSDTTSQIVYVTLETSKRNVSDSWMTSSELFPNYRRGLTISFTQTITSHNHGFPSLVNSSLYLLKN